jgi:putative ABC transport system permease protein
MHIFMRGTADPATLLAILTGETRRLDATLPIADAQPLERVMTSATNPPRLVMAGLAAFAGLALLLAAIGIYGVLSYTVTNRRREIGIRMALGARPSEILRSVLRDGIALGLAGAALGVAGAAVGGRALSTLLYGVTPTDPLTLVGVAALAIGVTLIACALPGRRAAATHPMETLRSD